MNKKQISKIIWNTAWMSVQRKKSKSSSITTQVREIFRKKFETAQERFSISESLFFLFSWFFYPWNPNERFKPSTLLNPPVVTCRKKALCIRFVSDLFIINSPENDILSIVEISLFTLLTEKCDAKPSRGGWASSSLKSFVLVQKPFKLLGELLKHRMN